MRSRLHRIKDWTFLAEASTYDPACLAKRCGICRRQLERFFRSSKGTTVVKWLDAERLEVARERLSEGFSVKEVASQLGFSSPQQFARKFKAGFGHPPSQLDALANGRQRQKLSKKATD